MQCGALHVHAYDTYLGKCGAQIGNLLSVRHAFYINEGYGRVEMHPLNLKFNISMVKMWRENITNDK